MKDKTENTATIQDEIKAPIEKNQKAKTFLKIFIGGVILLFIMNICKVVIDSFTEKTKYTLIIEDHKIVPAIPDPIEEDKPIPRYKPSTKSIKENLAIAQEKLKGYKPDASDNPEQAMERVYKFAKKVGDDANKESKEAEQSN